MKKISYLLIIVFYLISDIVIAVPLQASHVNVIHGQQRYVLQKPESEVQMQLRLEAEKDPLKDTVLKADLIVLGTITDKRYEIITRGEGVKAGKFTYNPIYTVGTKSDKRRPGY